MSGQYGPYSNRLEAITRIEEFDDGEVLGKMVSFEHDGTECRAYVAINKIDGSLYMLCRCSLYTVDESYKWVVPGEIPIKELPTDPWAKLPATPSQRKRLLEFIRENGGDV